uniref:Uncharacterized protein n=1 Tax=Oryzias latipes TaxID=8090 RepID=A0A3P9J9E2_ORYLA
SCILCIFIYFFERHRLDRYCLEPSLEYEKMKTIDKEYEHFNKDQMFSFQSKLAEYKREIETQMEASMNAKLHHFKEVEIAKVRLEEKSKFHKEFDNLKRELERNYEMKAKALMEREKNAIEGLQKHKEIEEKDIYMQRQSTLKDIESLRNRENELRMRMEAFENYQLELKEEFIKRTEKLTENENRNRVETARMQQESAALNARSEEHSRTCAKLKQLQISLLTQQKDLLRERLESTSDYPSLRRERTELQGQMQLLKKQLEEIREENRRLHAGEGKPAHPLLLLLRALCLHALLLAYSIRNNLNKEILRNVIASLNFLIYFSFQ